MRIREKLKSQSGRSMVEMLGVLAIIGVLTIGGIAGYTFAMNKYRTNEILDGASKRAITVATQLAIEANPDLSEYAKDNDVAGGTFTDHVEEYDNGQFGLYIDGVKKAVCEGLVKTAGGKVALRAIVDQDAQDASTDMTSADCKDENKLVLVFNNSGSAKDSGESRVAPFDRQSALDELTSYCQKNFGGPLEGCFSELNHDDRYVDCRASGQTEDCCLCISAVGRSSCDHLCGEREVVTLPCGIREELATESEIESCLASHNNDCDCCYCLFEGPGDVSMCQEYMNTCF